MRARLQRGWLLGVLGLLAWEEPCLAQELPLFETLDQYTRLQLPALGGTTFRLLGGRAGEATLVLDRIAADSLQGLDSWADSRVSQVQVRPLGLDRAEVTVRFRDPATESFAYLQGGKVVLDVWKQKGAPAAATEVADSAAGGRAPASVPAALRAGRKARPAKAVARKPASAANKAGAAAKPGVEPLRMGRDLFQKVVFPMPALVLEAKSGLQLPPRPDLEGRWKFSEADKSTEEGKAYDLVKTLFGMKKYGLCIKSIGILRRKFPEPANPGELDFLEALSYKALGEATKVDALVARSEKMLQELAARRDGEGAALPFQQGIELYFAEKEYLAGNWLQAIQFLEPIAARTGLKDADFPFVQMMLADSYGKVNQPRRAERIYRYLVEKLPRHQLAKEAYYRIADLLALEKNYKRVDEEGAAALKAYPEFEKARAEVLFQVGEANFWLGNYARAERFFRRYVEVGSSSTDAAFGWVRLGEIQEIVHGNLRAARESYLRAKNGYPFSKGDLVATVRMARIDLPGEKDPSFVVKTLREMLADGALAWELRRMAELTLVDYLVLSGEIDEAIRLARKGMNDSDGQVNELFKERYADSLFAKLAELAKNRKFPQALALFNEQKKWIELHGPEAFRVAAEIHRGLGLFASANRYMDLYARARAKARGLASVEGDPALARTKAANSFSRGDYQDVVAQLEGLGDFRSLYLKAVAEFRLGHKQDAYRLADRVVAELGGRKNQFQDAEVDNLFEIAAERDMADRDFPRLAKDAASCRGMREKEGELIEFTAADALWYQKRHGEALKAYKAAIALFPKSERAERARYNMGMSLVSLGKRDEAVKLLTAVRDSGQSVWAESARQELELIEWEKKYSSVLRTLPPSGLGIAN